MNIFPKTISDKIVYSKGYTYHDPVFGSDLIPALYQAELQEWLRNEHGVSVLVYLDETLSYFWVVTNLDTKVSIEGHHGPEKVQCKHYEACLEEGLRIALRLL